MDNSHIDIIGMNMALNEAKSAADSKEVPVGAAIFYRGVFLCSAKNEREKRHDPTAHAEILALQQASKLLSSWRLIDCTLYVTQEPCPMCAGAILNARLPKLVYGCKNPKAGSVNSLYQLLKDPRLNHQVEVINGVLALECSLLLKNFFTKLREKSSL